MLNSFQVWAHQQRQRKRERDDNRMMGDDSAPPTVRRPRRPGEYEYEDNRHHQRTAPQDPNCHREQPFAGWKHGAARPWTMTTTTREQRKTGLASLPVNGDDNESKRPSGREENIIQLECDDPRAIDFRNCLRTWFCKVPWSLIKLFF